MKDRKKEPWRILLAIISAALIVFMWVRKDIANIISTMPEEHILPMVVTGIVVTAIKAVCVAVLVLIAKWLFGKIRNKKK